MRPPKTEYQRKYRAYLLSPEWQSKRLRILKRAAGRCEWCGRFCGRPDHDQNECCYHDAGECQWCLQHFDEHGEPLYCEDEKLEVHHRTYERVFNEPDEDLVAICQSCHDAVTDRMFELRRLVAAGKLDRKLATPENAYRRFGELFYGTTLKDTPNVHLTIFRRGNPDEGGE